VESSHFLFPCHGEKRLPGAAIDELNFYSELN
jgi:hypothetical protein